MVITFDDKKEENVRFRFAVKKVPERVILMLPKVDVADIGMCTKKVCSFSLSYFLYILG